MEKKRIPFTASALPAITNYQINQVDPEDATKTINYASIFGPYPDVRCIIIEDATHGYQRQQDPFFKYKDGLIDTIYFDLGEVLTGYLILS